MKAVYNKKLEYLMCKWLCNPNRKYNEIRLRAVYSENEIPVTKLEHSLKRVKITWELIRLHNYEDAYKLFLNEDINNEIGELVNYVRAVRFDPIETLLKLYTNHELTDNQTMYLFLIYNHLRIKNGLYPVFSKIENVKKIHKFTQSKDIELVCQILHVMDLDSKRITSTRKKLRLSRVIQIIEGLNSVLKSDYDIISLYIYGSFARSNTNIYSDVDLIGISSLVQSDPLGIVNMQRFIESETGTKVDLTLLEKEEDLVSLNKNITRDLIKIY